MRGDRRVYPDEPAGPFPEPPVAITDEAGRSIEVRAATAGAAVPEALVAMYDAFDHADRAQGIPPTDVDGIRRWLETLYADGLNAVAWHCETAAGHATLVPAGDGRNGSAETDPGDATAPEDDRAASETADGDPAARPHELAIFVLQDYQEAGIGTHLLEALLGHAQSAGIERVWLTVERWNQPAIRLYQKVGFATAGTGNFDMEMAIRL